MLGKRSRSIQRTQNESHSFMKEKNPKSGFFNAPRIFIGFALKYPAEAAGDGSRSPTSPLECRRCFETVDSRSKTNAAVGLGILAALQAESAETAKSNVVSPKNSIARLFFKEIRQVTEKSQPIPIKRQVVKEEENVDDESELEFSESYTCVTTHGSKSVTKHVYIDNREIEVVASSKASKATVFEASSFTDESSLPVADFLSACFLCGRPLCAGKDIYMYRGDRAFCSVECRYQQIVSDEKKERNCSSVMKRSFMSASPQKRGSCYQRQPKALFTVAAA